MSVRCQVCGGTQQMSRVLSLGYMPPPNDMRKEHDPQPQTWLPTEMWWCSACELAQLGYVPDKTVAFPPDYPYTSGATPALRKNFEELAGKCERFLKPGDLVVDIGANDGTLLDCFTDYKTLGVEPTNVGHFAKHTMVHKFFNKVTANSIEAASGKAKLITCTNCFAHMPDIHDVVEGIKLMLADGGVFVSESHYLIDLIDKLQYDTIYAEHLRYYTIRSIQKLLMGHGLRVVDVEKIPTHGGSIRVYAQKTLDAVSHYDLFREKYEHEMEARLGRFAKQVQSNRLFVLKRLAFLKSLGIKIVGIGAPSRGSTVINYLHLDAGILDYVCEQSHSHKIGLFMPGTDIPVVDEKRLYEEQPGAAILFSWHLADELVPKLRKNGYRGEIILPCSATVINEPVETVESFRVPPGGGHTVRAV